MRNHGGVSWSALKRVFENFSIFSLHLQVKSIKFDTTVVVLQRVAENLQRLV